MCEAGRAAPEDGSPEGHLPADAAPADAPDGGRRPRTAIVRPAVAWTLVAALAGWLVVRVSGVGAGTWVETVIVFTPYVAISSVVGVVVVALLRARAALIAAGVCSAGYVLVMAPLFVHGPHPSNAPTGPDLRVMTVNVQFGWADAERVVDLVDRGGIDLLGVQELTPEFHERLLSAGIRDRLPHTVVDPRAGAAGTGIYSRHRLSQVGVDIAGRHENPTARVTVPGAPTVEVTVVHPVPPVGASRQADWRATLRTLPRPDVDPDHPDGSDDPDDDPATTRVLLGDFNATLDQPTMRDLLDDGYVDAADADGRAWVTTWRSQFALSLTIDHVLIDHTVAADQVSVHSVDGSDHRALAARLRLPAALDE